MKRWISSDSERDVLRRAAGRIDRVGPTGWGRTQCPFCLSIVGTADARGGLGIHFPSGYCHCFRCKTRGFLDRSGKKSEVAPPIPAGVEAEQDPELGPPPGFVPLWSGPGLSSISLAPAHAYLASRGVGAQTIEEARIGVCLEGAAANRIVVPILDLDGVWLGWQARAWVSGYRVKYLSATGFDRENHVYNAAALAVDTDDPVLVVEGTFDALPYWPDVCALLGKPSEGQIDLLLSASRPIVVALDGDAWLEGEMLAARLELDGAKAVALRLPPTRDPGDIPPAKVIAAARRAVAV